MLTLAKEIMEGRRLTRKDNLSFFLDCDLQELCNGAVHCRFLYNPILGCDSFVLGGYGVRQCVGKGHHSAYPSDGKGV